MLFIGWQPALTLPWNGLSSRSSRQLKLVPSWAHHSMKEGWPTPVQRWMLKRLATCGILSQDEWRLVKYQSSVMNSSHDWGQKIISDLTNLVVTIRTSLQKTINTDMSNICVNIKAKVVEKVEETVYNGVQYSFFKSSKGLSFSFCNIVILPSKEHSDPAVANCRKRPK